MKIFKTCGLVVLLSLLALAGCGPRGETKSLEEVLALAKSRFQRVSGVEVAGPASSSLKETIDLLSQVSSEESSHIVQQLNQVADKLSLLVSHASYTVRPALGELINEYRSLASASSHGAPSAAQLKLLAARTYGLLASELETARFML